MRVLFLDCFSGISGDMTVGALCDLGVPPSTFEWELSKLPIGDFHLHFEHKQRQHVRGVKFTVHGGAAHTHGQDEPIDEHGQVFVQKHEHAREHSRHEDGHEHEHEHEHGPECDHGHEHEQARASEHHEHAHEHVHGPECEHGHHEHEHEPGHGDEVHDHGRTYVEIRALIVSSDLSEFVKKHALSIFHRIALAEAKIHGVPVEDIGFHEVGALDSITDVVCACVGLEALGVEKIFVSPLVDGHGWVDCAHGRFPVPSMATLEILKGVPVSQMDEPFEFITPTGAAIAVEFASSFGVMPQMKIEKIGYGLGTRQLPNRPNVLRAVLGELVSSTAGAPLATGYEVDTIAQIETNIDDLSPEITGAMIDRLLAAGALDVFFNPVQMKKNRPGVVLTVLCETNSIDHLADSIFRETSAFGLRLAHKPRLKLARQIVKVETEYGAVEVKLGSRRDGELLQVAPEYESCRAASERSGVALRMVYQAASLAYEKQKHRHP